MTLSGDPHYGWVLDRDDGLTILLSDNDCCPIVPRNFMIHYFDVRPSVPRLLLSEDVAFFEGSYGLGDSVEEGHEGLPSPAPSRAP